MRIIIVFICIFIHFSSCMNNRSDKILKLINSGNLSDRVDGYLSMKGRSDTIYLKYIFKYDREDYKIIHNFRHLGKTVLWAKVVALENISGFTSPVPNSRFPDSSIIPFYKKWAIKNGYLK